MVVQISTYVGFQISALCIDVIPLSQEMKVTSRHQMMETISGSTRFQIPPVFDFYFTLTLQILIFDILQKNNPKRISEENPDSNCPK